MHSWLAYFRLENRKEKKSLAYFELQKNRSQKLLHILDVRNVKKNHWHILALGNRSKNLLAYFRLGEMSRKSWACLDFGNSSQNSRSCILWYTIPYFNQWVNPRHVYIQLLSFQLLSLWSFILMLINQVTSIHLNLPVSKSDN